mmetsp:Transcript_22808/g.90461  ORF Transcript_22808/g.90461 Transcript_22808/m.90461 type:complete len:220 (-) Transcript_22808:259-918(-)
MITGTKARAHRRSRPPRLRNLKRERLEREELEKRLRAEGDGAQELDLARLGRGARGGGGLRALGRHGRRRRGGRRRRSGGGRRALTLTVGWWWCRITVMHRGEGALAGELERGDGGVERRARDALKAALGVGVGFQDGRRVAVVREEAQRVQSEERRQRIPREARRDGAAVIISFSADDVREHEVRRRREHEAEVLVGVDAEVVDAEMRELAEHAEREL